MSDAKKDFEVLKAKAEAGDAQAQYELSEKYCFGDYDLGIEEDETQRIYWLKKSAENGYAQAQYELAEQYRDGNEEAEIEKDSEKYIYWTVKAAENGYEDAQEKLEAIQEFVKIKKYAEKGDAQAQYELSEKYRFGDYDLGIEEDETQRVYWFKKSVENGYAQAQYELAEQYRAGNEESGIEKDREQFIFWLTKAAENGYEDAQEKLNEIQESEKIKKRAEDGDAQAQYELSEKYDSGDDDLGIEIDQKKRIRLLLKAAIQNYAPAMYKIAEEYKCGNKEAEIKYDDKRYITWLKKAAENGYVQAQYELADHYRDGYEEGGIKKYGEEFIYWLTKVAESGNEEAQERLNKIRDFPKIKKRAEEGDAQAQYELSEYYSWGNIDLDIEKDVDEQLYWLKKAVENNHAEAQYKVALYYFWGDRKQGIKFDDKQYIAWLKEAAKNGSVKAKGALAEENKIKRLIKEAEEEGAERMSEVALGMMWMVEDERIGSRARVYDGLKLLRKAVKKGADYDRYVFGDEWIEILLDDIFSEEMRRKFEFVVSRSSADIPLSAEALWNFQYFPHSDSETSEESLLRRAYDVCERFDRPIVAYKLGLLSQSGADYGRDSGSAIDYFESAIADEDSTCGSEPSFYKGIMLAIGDGVEQSMEDALENFTKSNNDDANVLLYAVHKFGLMGQESDIDKSKEIYDEKGMAFSRLDFISIVGYLVYKKIFEENVRFDDGDLEACYWADLAVRRLEYSGRYDKRYQRSGRGNTFSKKEKYKDAEKLFEIFKQRFSGLKNKEQKEDVFEKICEEYGQKDLISPIKEIYSEDNNDYDDMNFLSWQPHYDDEDDEDFSEISSDVIAEFPKTLKQRAEAGDAKAQYAFSKAYGSLKSSNNILGLKEDEKQRIFWLIKSAEKGYGQAQYDLAKQYLNGNEEVGIKKDKEKSAYLFVEVKKNLEKRANENDAQAQYELSKKYRFGDDYLGIDGDSKQFVYWLKKSAESGYGKAQHDLAEQYRDGNEEAGIEEDREQFMYWLQKSDESTDPYMVDSLMAELLKSNNDYDDDEDYDEDEDEEDDDWDDEDENDD